MAVHTASRLSLLAFAMVALRGVLDGTDFEATLVAALTYGATVFPAGLALGELARRLVEDVVRTHVAGVLAETVPQQSAVGSPIQAQPA